MHGNRRKNSTHSATTTGTGTTARRDCGGADKGLSESVVIGGVSSSNIGFGGGEFYGQGNSSISEEGSASCSKTDLGLINVKVNMDSTQIGHLGMQQQHIGNSVIDQQANASFKMPVTDFWGVTGSTKVKIRTNHSVRIILGLFLIFLITGCILNFRIQSLETKNSELESQLQDVQLLLAQLVDSIAQIQPIVPTAVIHDMNAYSGNADNDQRGYKRDDGNEDSVVLGGPDNHGSDSVSRDKRSIIPNAGVATAMAIPISGLEDLILTSDNSSNSFKNGDVGKLEFGSKMSGGGKKHRGNNNKRNKTRDRESKKLLNMENAIEKQKFDLKKLRLKLKNAQTRNKEARTHAETLRHKLQASVFSATLRNDPRAAYLTVSDPSIYIEHPKQLIGPWHFADSGIELGFNDLWYKNLALDDKGTSVIFGESGLFLIYAQVFYKSVSDKNPLGFRIYLKKSEQITNNVFRRPIPIAECVPAFPNVHYQTCFTQICWFIEEGDEVYLEHFTDAKPLIGNEKRGQTFLGIVRLSA